MLYKNMMGAMACLMIMQFRRNEKNCPLNILGLQSNFIQSRDVKKDAASIREIFQRNRQHSAAKDLISYREARSTTTVFKILLHLEKCFPSFGYNSGPRLINYMKMTRSLKNKKSCLPVLTLPPRLPPPRSEQIVPPVL